MTELVIVPLAEMKTFLGGVKGCSRDPRGIVHSVIRFEVNVNIAFEMSLKNLKRKTVSCWKGETTGSYVKFE